MKRRLLLVCALVLAGGWTLLAVNAALAQVEPPAETPAAQSSAIHLPPGAGHVASEATSLLQELDFRALWLENGPADWLVLGVAILVSLAAGRIAAVVLGRLAGRLQSRGWRVRPHVLSDLTGPAGLTLLALGLTVGLADLRMSPAMHAFRLRTLLLLYSIAVFWYAYNLIGVIDLLVQRLRRRSESRLDQQLVPLLRKTLRIILVIVGVLFFVESVFSQDIGAWLAGLGIAGLAVSLAAQDSLKNLFGSITILLDQPFRIGERIICSGHDGVVEEIGFRSTALRTANGSLVTIPNANIVTSPVENVGRRPYIRRSMNLAIPRDTSEAKVAQAVKILQGILGEGGIGEPIHAEIQGQLYPPRVYFSDVNPDNLSLSVTYWFAPPDYWQYMEHAEKVNLRILAEFAAAGVAFAPPAQEEK